MIGIYKITSPNNRVYIGQSINIEKRFIGYKRMYVKNISLKSNLIKILMSCKYIFFVNRRKSGLLFLEMHKFENFVYKW